MRCSPSTFRRDNENLYGSLACPSVSPPESLSLEVRGIKSELTNPMTDIGMSTPGRSNSESSHHFSHRYTSDNSFSDSFVCVLVVTHHTSISQILNGFPF